MKNNDKINTPDDSTLYSKDENSLLKISDMVES